jgi:hypothetical protein
MGQDVPCLVGEDKSSVITLCLSIAEAEVAAELAALCLPSPLHGRTCFGDLVPQLYSNKGIILLTPIRARKFNLAAFGDGISHQIFNHGLHLSAPRCIAVTSTASTSR